jgi:uncharacterized SAM-dependent methyltransferase
MRLMSTQRQAVAIAGAEIPFDENEYIITEYSHKYSIDEFHALARRAGFEPARSWIDDDGLFSVHYMSAH